MTSDAVRHKPDDGKLADILALIQKSFAYMDARIDPPSSMHRLTVSDIAEKCETGEVWTIGNPFKACVFLTKKPDCLYLGKVAVDKNARGEGLGRALVALAEQRAKALGYSELE